MNTTSKERVRRSYQGKLLKKAGEGNFQALNNVLKYLSSKDSTLCGIMQSAIHEFYNCEIWRILLLCFANHRYKNDVDNNRALDQEASKRIDQAIYEVYAIDRNELEKRNKEIVLDEAMEDPRQKIRQTGAFFAGIRGDIKAVPQLSETIRTGDLEWRLRAVKALTAIGEEDCIPSLVSALIMDRGELHRAARRALTNMGKLAESAWIDLLKNPDSHIRWEAARGLGAIGDARAAYILVEGLQDTNYAVRWATADVLSQLGEGAIPAILEFLCIRVPNEQSRQAAYHALNNIKSRQTKERIGLLLSALRNPIVDGSVSRIAGDLLSEWQ